LDFPPLLTRDRETEGECAAKKAQQNFSKTAAKELSINNFLIDEAR
jgi:hypothetical protein